MAEDTITTVMELDLGPFRKALEQMPADAQKALKELERKAIASAKETNKLQAQLSKKTATEVSKHARDAARDIKRTARETERAYDEQFTSIMGLSGAAFGGMAGDVEDLGITLGGISGPLAVVGLGLAALSIAPEVIRGIHEFAAGAEETAEALGTVLTGEDKRRADAFAASTANLARDFNEAKLAAQLMVADGIVPIIQTGAELISILKKLAGPVLWFKELSDAVKESKAEFIALFGPLSGVLEYLTAGAGQVKIFAEAFGDATATFEPMSAGLLEVRDALKAVGEESEKTGKVHFDSSMRASGAAAEFLQRLKDEKKANEDAAKAARDRASALMEAEAAADIKAGIKAEEENAAAIALNRITEIGGWDDKALADILSDLAARGEDAFDGIGYDGDDLDQMLRELTPPEFKEYDESTADDVQYIECPECGHKFPK